MFDSIGSSELWTFVKYVQFMNEIALMCHKHKAHYARKFTNHSHYKTYSYNWWNEVIPQVEFLYPDLPLILTNKDEVGHVIAPHVQ